MTPTSCLILALGGGACLLLALAPTERPPRLIFNATASAPLGFYSVDDRAPLVGDLAVVRPPQKLALWMAMRGYLPSNVPLIKRVAAGTGQTVCGQGGEIRIDGRVAAAALTQDRRGRRLEPFTGCVGLRDGDVFLLNAETPDSFDGRYFGPLQRSAVVGRATALWTWSGR